MLVASSLTFCFPRDGGGLNRNVHVQRGMRWRWSLPVWGGMPRTSHRVEGGDSVLCRIDADMEGSVMVMPTVSANTIGDSAKFGEFNGVVGVIRDVSG